MAVSDHANLASVIVSDEDLATYERDGVVCLRGLFDDDWVAELRDVLAHIQKSYVNEHDDIISFTQQCLASKHPELMRFVRESPAAAIAKRIMRSERVQFYFDQIFIKEPGMRTPGPWHNDLPYWPVQGDQVCSIWLALDNVSKASSGLEYVAGSHRWSKSFKASAGGADKSAFAEDEEMPDINANRSSYHLLNWDMRPGDCLVHHGLAVHGAGGNTTLHTRRRAFATRWIGDDARYRAGGGDPYLTVEGLGSGDMMPTDRFPFVDV